MRRNITDDSASRSDFAIALVIEGRTEGEPMRRNLTGIDIQDVEALNALGASGGPATATIHLTLQGKGGVGKGLVSSILAQYFRPRGVLASRISSRTSERCEAFSWRSPSRRSVVSVSRLRFYRTVNEADGSCLSTMHLPGSLPPCHGGERTRLCHRKGAL